MPLFENTSCPVCKRKFEEGDDIVYCPECGTPHHRECYNAVGHCVNRGLHASGYSFYDDMKANSENQSNIQNEHNSFYTPHVSVQEERKDNSESAANPLSFPNPMQMDSVYEKDEQKISGESVADFAATIRTNIPRFINLFKEFEYKGRKTSWNWSAFFFGSLYMFFRKMYKQGIAFLSAFVAVVYASCFAMMKLAPNYIEAAKDFANLYAQNKATYEDMAALANNPDMSKANLILYATFGIILILRIIQALFADRYYKATVASFIKSVNEQLNDEASFMQTSLLLNQSNDLTQLQIKRYYLARRGGTSIFLPLMAASIIYFLILTASSTIFF